jgi:hypothetical protein
VTHPDVSGTDSVTCPSSMLAVMEDAPQVQPAGPDERSMVDAPADPPQAAITASAPPIVMSFLVRETTIVLTLGLSTSEPVLWMRKGWAGHSAEPTNAIRATNLRTIRITSLDCGVVLNDDVCIGHDHGCAARHTRRRSRRSHPSREPARPPSPSPRRTMDSALAAPRSDTRGTCRPGRPERGQDSTALIGLRRLRPTLTRLREAVTCEKDSVFLLVLGSDGNVKGAAWFAGRSSRPRCDRVSSAFSTTLPWFGSRSTTSGCRLGSASSGS